MASVMPFPVHSVARGSPHMLRIGGAGSVKRPLALLVRSQVAKKFESGNAKALSHRGDITLRKRNARGRQVGGIRPVVARCPHCAPTNFRRCKWNATRASIEAGS